MRRLIRVLLVEECGRAGAEIVFADRPVGAGAEQDLLLRVQGMIAEYERGPDPRAGPAGPPPRRALWVGRRPGQAALRPPHHHEGRGRRRGARRGGGRGRPRGAPDVRPGLGLDRVGLREACRRLAEAGGATSTGKPRWDPTTIALMLRDTAHVGRAVFGRSRHVQAPPRLRPLRGCPHPARRPNSRVPVPREEWIEVPAPALVDPAVFEAAQAPKSTGAGSPTCARAPPRRPPPTSTARSPPCAAASGGRSTPTACGLIERGEFEPRVEGMRLRLSRSERERRAMVAHAGAERDLTLLVGRLEELAGKVRSGLETLDWEGTREVMRAMVRRVEVDGDHVDVVFRVPPPTHPGGDEHPRGPTRR